jgi:hypothetical protein
MAKATLSLDGLDEYLEKLRQAEQDIDQVAEEGLMAGSAVLIDGMQARAPFLFLRQAIRQSAVMKDGNRRYLYLGVLRGTDAETARIANVWEFGGRQERSNRHGTRWPRPNIVARPFIRPALREDARRARNALVRVFRDWLDT